MMQRYLADADGTPVPIEVRHTQASEDRAREVEAMYFDRPLQWIVPNT